MALQMQIFYCGLIVPEAYIKVTALSLVPSRQECGLEITTYANRQARIDGLSPLTAPERALCANRYEEITGDDGQVTTTCTCNDFETFFCDTVLKSEGVSGISQAYEWLKTLPVFSGAVNV